MVNWFVIKSQTCWIKYFIEIKFVKHRTSKWSRFTTLRNDAEAKVHCLVLDDDRTSVDIGRVHIFTRFHQRIIGATRRPRFHDRSQRWTRRRVAVSRNAGPPKNKIINMLKYEIIWKFSSCHFINSIFQKYLFYLRVLF